MVAGPVARAALFAGMALAGVSTPQSPTGAPTVSPACSSMSGDTIGLGRIIRFRVIAASDSPFDQAVKLRVRDAVLDYLRPELQGAASDPRPPQSSPAGCRGSARLPSRRCRRPGRIRPVQVFYGVTAFPVKNYGSVIFPAGNYQALKIVIGPGQGKNWWCVLFPPLCYVDLTQAAQDLSGGEQIAPARRAWMGRLTQYPRLTTKIGVWLSSDHSHGQGFMARK